MSVAHFILATAGHVDHGKSSLVKALTGIDPDRLPEEKARGITIDLGFAHLDLPGTMQGQPATFRLGLVDVPGHEDFVRNMVAGVGSIDTALLVVAADDGWMPQTEEHLQILIYLGVTRAVIALTKADLVSDAAGAVAEVRTKLQGTPFTAAPIVSTSVATGVGLNELKAALTTILSSAPLPRDIGKPRLPIDRVFTLRGVGTVVTGTLTGGRLQKGQSVSIQPSNQPGRIRSIQSHNQDVDIAPPGTRTALNLPDDGGSRPRRGDVVTLSELSGGSTTWDVLLTKSDRPDVGKRGVGRTLKNGSRQRIHLGSSNIPAHIFFIEAKALGKGEQALAQVRFDEPMFAFAGDRFIVRDWPEQVTLAGGVILCPDADRRRFRTTPRRALLAARAQATDDPAVFVRTQLARDSVVDVKDLLSRSRFSMEEVTGAVGTLAASGEAIMIGPLVCDGAWWKQLRTAATEAIDAAHKLHPDRRGLPLNELRGLLQKNIIRPEMFEILVRELPGFVQEGTVIRRAAHKPALPPNLAAAGAKVRAALSLQPLQPPSRKEVAPDGPAQQALRFLIQSGEAVELGPDVVLLAEHFQRATGEIQKYLRQHGSAAASDLRQMLGTSRRIVIPVLERLEREGVTKRDGDKHLLKKPV